MSEIWVSSLSWASRVSISVMTPLSLSSLSCSFIVIHPVWRQGLEIDALAKHIFFSPADSNCEVSTISGSIICRYGLSSGPCGSMSRCASCVS